jgi:hypothetical protein
MLHMQYIGSMNAEMTYPVKKLVNLTEDQAARISAFRFDERIPSENEAIRRLIDLGLAAAGAVTVDELISYCRDQKHFDQAEVIESLVFEVQNPSDKPFLHSFPLDPRRR